MLAESLTVIESNTMLIYVAAIFFQTRDKSVIAVNQKDFRSLKFRSE